MSPTLQSTPQLTIRTPDGKSRVVELRGDRIGVGRSSVNELSYPDDAGLSRQHLAVVRHDNGWVAEDLGSKNGTLVNGVRIAEPHLLQPGDRITVGHLTLEFGGTPERGPETVVFIDNPQEEQLVKSPATVSTSLAGVLGAGGPEDLSKTPVFQGSPQMRALIRAGKELVEHRPLPDLFQVIMDLSVEAVGARRGVLMSLEGEELVVRAARGSGFQISSAVRDRVLREKTSLLVRDAQVDQAFKERMSIVEHQVRSILAVPLQTNDRVIGLIYLDSPHFIREFTTEDLSLLTVMANVAAIRIEHARLAEVEQAERVLARDLEQAALIQRGLLPIQAPSIPGLDVAGHNTSSRTVGGDYYDFLPYPDGRIAILVADVAGKGMPAALLMSSLQARAQVIFEAPDDLAARVSKLNRVLSTKLPDNRFITFFICVIDPRRGELRYCNAGHNPPLLLRRDGRVEQLAGGGMILGIRPTAQYEEFRRQLEEGDIAVFFSDGVTEASRPDSEEDFGEQRLAELVWQNRGLSAAGVVNAVVESVAAFTAGSPADDITVVVARRVSPLDRNITQP